MNSRSVFPEFDIRERKSPKFRDTLPLEGSKKIYGKKHIFSPIPLRMAICLQLRGKNHEQEHNQETPVTSSRLISGARFMSSRPDHSRCALARGQ